MEHGRSRSTFHKARDALGVTPPKSTKSQPSMDKAEESRQGSLVPRKRKYVEVDPEDMAV